MTTYEVIQGLDVVRYPLYAFAFGIPVLIWAIGRTGKDVAESRVFGHVASALVAVGMLAMLVDVGMCVYLHNKGVDLLADVSFSAIAGPFWFGLGTLWSSCQIIPFATLRQFPLLRRVWAILSVIGLIIAALFVLKHTFWLVFSGIMGFLVVALIFWSVFENMLGKVFSAKDTDDSADESVSNE